MQHCKGGLFYDEEIGTSLYVEGEVNREERLRNRAVGVIDSSYLRRQKGGDKSQVRWN